MKDELIPTIHDRLRILAAFPPCTTIQALDLKAMTVTVRLAKPMKYCSIPFRLTPAAGNYRGPEN